MRQFPFDVFTGADKVLRIIIVLLNTRRHGKDIGVKNDVFGRESDVFSEDVIGPAANFNFTLAGVGLADFIKRHDHHGGTVAAHQLRMMNESLHALFHGNGVNNAFTLDALQAFLYDIPFRGVDHDRYAGNIRLTGNQIQKTHHRRFGIEHPFIHIDIDDLRAALYLLQRDFQRFVIFFFFNEAFEFGRAGHVSPLAYVHEQAVRADVERLKTGKAAGHGNIGQFTRCNALYGFAHGGDMRRRRAAAAADDI